MDVRVGVERVRVVIRQSYSRLQGESTIIDGSCHYISIGLTRTIKPSINAMMNNVDERIDIGDVVNSSLQAFQVEQLRLENAFLRQSQTGKRFTKFMPRPWISQYFRMFRGSLCVLAALREHLR